MLQNTREIYQARYAKVKVQLTSKYKGEHHHNDPYLTEKSVEGSC